ncbi:hypothetical protein C4D60_Mb10t11170 [Musa balbisiana]|uniref:Uncharacterized protein n=1 Tax=Musa balbisiana TaxID=52838 RepID=A0A4S8IW84_MUSBA|nr:hypothetical protein C4D60_Mb10t11170 [Musa balbisiana]
MRHPSANEEHVTDLIPSPPPHPPVSRVLGPTGVHPHLDYQPRKISKRKVKPNAKNPIGSSARRSVRRRLRLGNESRRFICPVRKL